MFALNRCAQVLACIAALGMVASPVLGATPGIAPAAKTSASVFDVKTSQGHLFGQVVNPTGNAEVGVDVVITSERNIVGKTKTDQFGRFAVPLSKTGVYRVAVGQRSFDIRAWQPEVAPPAAKTGLMCVTQDVAQNVVRAQYESPADCPCAVSAPAPSYAPAAPYDCGVAACGPCGGGMVGGGGGMLGGGGMVGGRGGLTAMLRNPLVVGLGVAAAIALPIALDDDDDDDSGSTATGGAGGSGEPAS